MSEVNRSFGTVCAYCGVAAIIGIGVISLALIVWVSML